MFPSCKKLTVTFLTVIQGYDSNSSLLSTLNHHRPHLLRHKRHLAQADACPPLHLHLSLGVGQMVRFITHRTRSIGKGIYGYPVSLSLDLNLRQRPGAHV